MKKTMTFCMAAVLSIGTVATASAAPLSIQTALKNSCTVYGGGVFCDFSQLLEKLEGCFPNLSFPMHPSAPSSPSVPSVPIVPSVPSQPDTPEADAPEADAPETDAPEAEDTAAAYAAEVIELVNQERAKAGLSALKQDEKAMQAAQLRAKEIHTSFSHTRPDGSSCFTALQEVGASYRAAGENIALGQKSPQEVVQAWMASEGHRANILSEKYSAIGVGYYENGWVQMFLG